MSFNKNLDRLFDAAAGVCCYCGCGTYMVRREPGPDAMRRFGIPEVPGSARVLAYRLASIERIVRHVDGGTYAADNIALACAFCNSHRGDASPEDHRAAMVALAASSLHPNHQAEPTPERLFRRAKRAPAITAPSLAA
ncbi:hypothetical protein [Methylobacterium gossipiicola]|uniref:HNH endonuclease n=1 Tax=Methylobacterium gossipiicola TaxID=582675 RepID=A0A1I2X7W9_9HYPH|nr:hypothetical protein [Methylobacterium gossipiicola]SFH08786.1 hypothetical protein SAMN05192565_1337 [Methylobacterium gossipiicola]